MDDWVVTAATLCRPEATGRRVKHVNSVNLMPCMFRLLPATDPLTTPCPIGLDTHHANADAVATVSIPSIVFWKEDCDVIFVSPL